MVQGMNKYETILNYLAEPSKVGLAMIRITTERLDVASGAFLFRAGSPV